MSPSPDDQGKRAAHAGQAENDPGDVVVDDPALEPLDRRGQASTRPAAASAYDLRTANGKKSFRDAINAAAYCSDRLSTRTRRGKRLPETRGHRNDGECR